MTVIAAAGNYGKDGAPSGVLFAPGNNPFVVTVGAVDIGGTARVGDDDRAPWSAYGRTQDGFWKPEICAPGRLHGRSGPDGLHARGGEGEQDAEPGYIELSGTSFSAPVISGIAAQILARNPDMTPDQVKGAIMRRARPVPRPSTARAASARSTRFSRCTTRRRRRTRTGRSTGSSGRPVDGPTVFDAVAGRTCHGATSPGTRSPGAMSPGATSPGTRSPGAMSPGATSPGAMSPGATSPGRTQPVTRARRTAAVYR